MATKLPSGKYRSQVFDGYDENKKRKYTSFIADTAKEADLMALQYSTSITKQPYKPENMTIDRYIESKDSVLSPSTIRGYRGIRQRNLTGIIDTKLSKITPEIVQREINREFKEHSSKTVHNIHGLLSAALNVYYPDLKLKTTLPQKEKKYIYMPTEEEVNQIIYCVTDTPMELPVLLAVCLGLRRSEICGLMWNDIDFGKNEITIRQAKVLNAENEFNIKTTKTYSGTRKLRIPDVLLEPLKKYHGDNEFVTVLNPNMISARFAKILLDLNITHFRYHDLRHYYASVLLALGVPDKYAMEQMGHATNNMLKNVYQHTLDKEKEKIKNKINDHFNQAIKKND